MPCIITTVHDPIALAATCQRLGLPPPWEGSIQLDGKQASGWIVHLLGLHAPIVVDTLRGLVAYHPKDNAFEPYARVMRFVLRYYDVRAALQRGQELAAHKHEARARRRRRARGEVG